MRCAERAATNRSEKDALSSEYTRWHQQAIVTRTDKLTADLNFKARSDVHTSKIERILRRYDACV
jgi:hypothetical protein